MAKHGRTRVPVNEHTETPTPPGFREVPKSQQCPLCYHGANNGIGVSNGLYEKASTLNRRYYRCDMCGHTWSADFKPEELLRINTPDSPVATLGVPLSGPNPPPLSTR